MRNVIGVGVIALSWAAAVVGCILMLVYGIMLALQGFQADPWNNGQIAWGVVIALFCEAPFILAVGGSMVGALIIDG